MIEQIPYLSLLIAVFLVYVPRGFVARAQLQQPGGLDNSLPRLQQAQLTGLGARAQGAHMNGFEAFSPFAAGVLACLHRGVNAATLAALCVAFLLARVVYIYLYLSNKSTLRSLVWGLGFFASLALLLLPLFA
jgi:uncharacterized MAPEG superfamily protein